MWFGNRISICWSLGMNMCRVIFYQQNSNIICLIVFQHCEIIYYFRFVLTPKNQVIKSIDEKCKTNNDKIKNIEVSLYVFYFNFGQGIK